MAFVTNDDDDDTTILSEDMTVPRSFITMHVTDPFSTAMEGSSEEGIPNAKRNLLDDLNNAESTMLPPPPQKENLAVYLRVKPKTKKESDLASGFNVGTSDTVNIVSDYQISLNAPQESQTFKNSVKGDKGRLIQSYTFTKILKPELGQQELFTSLVRPMVKDFLEGQNQLLFTYGATSAGKTFTMQGELGSSGIIPRSLDTVFNTIGGQVSDTVPVQPLGFNRVVGTSAAELDQVRRDKEAVFRLGVDLTKRTGGGGGRVSPDLSTMSGCSAASTGSTASVASSAAGGIDLANLAAMFPGLATRDKETTVLDIKDSDITYSVWVSFCEIYQDSCYDLLRKVQDSKKKGARETLRLCEGTDALPYVKGLKEIQVSTADEAYQILMIGRDNLHFAATKLNQQSSRSHCIFTVKVVRVADPDKPHLARVSIFSFCDLAGSERISKTNNVGDRQKETGNINTSLLILGRCIKAMRHNQACKDKRGQEIVPFRESKLTRLFKSYFTGQGKSSLIICISQAEYLFDETVHVCKFAHIASKVTIETFKEPPPKKAPRKSTSRFSTMVDREKSKLLSLAANASVLGRSSIAWEVPPGKKSSLMLGNFKPSARSTMAPGIQPPRMSSLLNISEIEDPGQEEEETVLENTVVQTQYEGLLQLVEDLKGKLIEERKKNVDLEKNIREELCNEFNNMLVEVEKGYEKRLQDEKEEAERVNEWRLGELNKVHSKRNKRRRENDEEDKFNEDEMQVARLESQLQTKTKDLEVLQKELEDCQSQVEVMKTTVVKSKQEQDKLQGANTKVQFELAEQQRLAAELGREVEAATAKLEEERERSAAIKDGKTDALLEAERMVSQLREELSTKEAEASELKELLEEAGTEFLEKEEELKTMGKELDVREGQVTQQSLVIEDLQAQLEESRILLEDVNNQLETKEDKIDELEQQIERSTAAKKEKSEKKVADLQEELNLTKMKCATGEEFSLEIKKRLDDAEKSAEQERLHAKEAEEKMLEAQQERNQLLSVKSKLLSEIAEMKSSRNADETIDVEKDTIELKGKIDNLVGLNKVLSESNESLKKDKEECRKEIHSLKMKVDELKSATSVDESLFEDEDDMKQRIESLLTEKSSLKESLSSVNMEMDNLKKERTRLLSQIEKQEVKDFDEMERLIERNSSLEEELSTERKRVELNINENEAKIRDAQSTIEDLQKVINDKEEIIKTLNNDKLTHDEELRSRIEDLEANFDNEKKEFVLKFNKNLEESEEKINMLTKEIEESKSLKYSQEQERSITVSDLESRNGSLEKDVATKDTYIKELEDIIVEKEFKISELENSPDEMQMNLDKISTLESEMKSLKENLTNEKENVKLLKNEIEKLQVVASENAETIAHQEKMKQQRDSLEERIKDCQKTSESLAKVEDELESLKNDKSDIEKKLIKSEEIVAKMKTELEDSKVEIKALKKATKESAKEALEASEIKVQNNELSKELERVNTIVEANNREQNALDVLKTELSGKSTELGQVQEKLNQLAAELGGKDKELQQLEVEMERVRADNEAKEYDLNKIKEERVNLMEHYDKMFKQKQAEIDSMKAANKEKENLGQIMAKATPSKSLGQVKEKLSRAEEELSSVKEKLVNEEEKVEDLKAELKQLQKDFDARSVQHQRETNRIKLANDKLIAEYRDTNRELQKKVAEDQKTASKVSATVTPPSPQDSSHTLEADDSKTDASLIESTPMARKRGGRGRGRGTRTTRSTASLASFEDSNTENTEPEGRPRVASVSRKARVTRKNSKSVSALADLDTTDNVNRSVSRKRGAAAKAEASVLKESQLLALSPVPEAAASHNSSRDISSVGATPVQKKKRKLYKQTPQLSEVFTPPTDRENDTPGEIVKKQLRSRRIKR